MLHALKLWNFSAGPLAAEAPCRSSFVLRTCQRTLVLSFDRIPFTQDELPKHEIHEGEAAYLFLLETICGLKSKLIGENEIVGQFKEAYKLYAASTVKDTRLLTILEKLFQDAKDIRTQYLIGISQKTYASLTRRHLIQRARARRVVIIGSGALAEDLINQFIKKAEVVVCARNESRVKELTEARNLASIPWDKRHELLQGEAFIANSVGSEDVLFDEAFFEAWASRNPERLFVDLGSPSAIRTSMALSQGVVRLDDIFAEGAIVEEQKQTQIALAREAMLSVTHRRKSLLEAKFNREAPVPAPQITSDVRYL
jgi:glutamyl-tRNA reductase